MFYSFSNHKNAQTTDNVHYTINDTQKSLIAICFNERIWPKFFDFVSSFSNNDKLVAAFIAYQSMSLNSENFINMLDNWYPKISDDLPLSEQRNRFRTFLCEFNKLFDSKNDVNHQLYNIIFDRRHNAGEPSSPTKRNVISSHFKELLTSSLNNSGYNLEMLCQNEEVKTVQGFITGLRIKTPIAKKLF